ncbi:hypothetical protein Tco_0470735 [Tanacetum coccineum]
MKEKRFLCQADEWASHEKLQDSNSRNVRITKSLNMERRKRVEVGWNGVGIYVLGLIVLERRFGIGVELSDGGVSGCGGIGVEL